MSKNPGEAEYAFINILKELKRKIDVNDEEELECFVHQIEYISFHVVYFLRNLNNFLHFCGL